MTFQNRQKQHGAALVVGLILLVVITVLAVSGMNTATTELAMARNDQNFENAFQAAETGLEQALAQPAFDPAVAATVTQEINANDSVSADISYESWSYVPDKAFSLGVGSGVSAHHFIAVSQASSRRDPDVVTDRDSTATHTQAFYIVGPEPPPEF